VTFGLARLFFAQPGGSSGALSELILVERIMTTHLLPGSSTRLAMNCAPSRWLAKPKNWLSEWLKISTSTNLLILPEIERERLLNTQKWDTKYLLRIFNKNYSQYYKKNCKWKESNTIYTTFLHKS